MKELFLETATKLESIQASMSVLGVYKPGQVHRYRHDVLHQERLVELIEKDSGGFSTAWTTRDVLTDRERVIDQRYLSLDTYNAMEVIAWAASLPISGPDPSTTS